MSWGQGAGAGMYIGIGTLSVRYDSKRIIDALSLDIAQGAFFTLLGPSGCGKTTLLRAVAGFVPVEAGHIRFAGTDVTHLPAHKRNIGMVFQDYALFPDKTVYDNVAYGLRARRKSEADINRMVGEALERVSLSAFADRYPAALSGGQRQRVALVRALVITPDVLLMDEPLSNLDAKLRHQVRDTIMELQRESGITTIFVTHDQDEALAMSDRIGVMMEGRLEQVGTPAEIYRAPRTGYVANFIGAANCLPVTVMGRVDVNAMLAVDVGGVRLSARASAPLQAGAATLVLRPEDIALSREGGPGTGRLEGTVIGRQFLGARTSYAVALPGGQRVSVDMHGVEHDRFAMGDAVSLTFDPAKALVVAS
jgi:iron(III) transport system ATP-binding protein